MKKEEKKDKKILLKSRDIKNKLDKLQFDFIKNDVFNLIWKQTQIDWIFNSHIKQKSQQKQKNEKAIKNLVKFQKLRKQKNKSPMKYEEMKQHINCFLQKLPEKLIKANQKNENIIEKIQNDLWSTYSYSNLINTQNLAEEKLQNGKKLNMDLINKMNNNNQQTLGQLIQNISIFLYNIESLIPAENKNVVNKKNEEQLTELLYNTFQFYLAPYYNEQIEILFKQYDNNKQNANNKPNNKNIDNALLKEYKNLQEKISKKLEKLKQLNQQQENLKEGDNGKDNLNTDIKKLEEEITDLKQKFETNIDKQYTKFREEKKQTIDEEFYGYLASKEIESLIKKIPNQKNSEEQRMQFIESIVKIHEQRSKEFQDLYNELLEKQKQLNTIDKKIKDRTEKGLLPQEMSQQNKKVNLDTLNEQIKNSTLTLMKDKNIKKNIEQEIDKLKQKLEIANTNKELYEKFISNLYAYIHTFPSGKKIDLCIPDQLKKYQNGATFDLDIIYDTAIPYVSVNDQNLTKKDIENSQEHIKMTAFLLYQILNIKELKINIEDLKKKALATINDKISALKKLKPYGKDENEQQKNIKIQIKNLQNLSEKIEKFTEQKTKNEKMYTEASKEQNELIIQMLILSDTLSYDEIYNLIQLRIGKQIPNWLNTLNTIQNKLKFETQVKLGQAKVSTLINILNYLNQQDAYLSTLINSVKEKTNNAQSKEKLQQMLTDHNKSIGGINKDETFLKKFNNYFLYNFFTNSSYLKPNIDVGEFIKFIDTLKEKLVKDLTILAKNQVILTQIEHTVIGLTPSNIAQLQAFDAHLADGIEEKKLEEKQNAFNTVVDDTFENANIFENEDNKKNFVNTLKNCTGEWKENILNQLGKTSINSEHFNLLNKNLIEGKELTLYDKFTYINSSNDNFRELAIKFDKSRKNPGDKIDEELIHKSVKFDLLKTSYYYFLLSEEIQQIMSEKDKNNYQKETDEQKKAMMLDEYITIYKSKQAIITQIKDEKDLADFYTKWQDIIKNKKQENITEFLKQLNEETTKKTVNKQQQNQVINPMNQMNPMNPMNPMGNSSQNNTQAIIEKYQDNIDKILKNVHLFTKQNNSEEQQIDNLINDYLSPNAKQNDLRQGIILYNEEEIRNSPLQSNPNDNFGLLEQSWGNFGNEDHDDINTNSNQQPKFNDPIGNNFNNFNNNNNFQQFNQINNGYQNNNNISNPFRDNQNAPQQQQQILFTEYLKQLQTNKNNNNAIEQNNIDSYNFFKNNKFQNILEECYKDTDLRKQQKNLAELYLQTEPQVPRDYNPQPKIPEEIYKAFIEAVPQIKKENAMTDIAVMQQKIKENTKQELTQQQIDAKKQYIFNGLIVESIKKKFKQKQEEINNDIIEKNLSKCDKRTFHKILNNEKFLKTMSSTWQVENFEYSRKGYQELLKDVKAELQSRFDEMVDFKIVACGFEKIVVLVTANSKKNLEHKIDISKLKDNEKQQKIESGELKTYVMVISNLTTLLKQELEDQKEKFNEQQICKKILPDNDNNAMQFLKKICLMAYLPSTIFDNRNFQANFGVNNTANQLIKYFQNNNIEQLPKNPQKKLSEEFITAVNNTIAGNPDLDPLDPNNDLIKKYNNLPQNTANNKIIFNSFKEFNDYIKKGIEQILYYAKNRKLKPQDHMPKETPQQLKNITEFLATFKNEHLINKNEQYKKEVLQKLNRVINITKKLLTNNEILIYLKDKQQQSNNLKKLFDKYKDLYRILSNFNGADNIGGFFNELLKLSANTLKEIEKKIPKENQQPLNAEQEKLKQEIQTYLEVFTEGVANEKHFNELAKKSQKLKIMQELLSNNENNVFTDMNSGANASDIHHIINFKKAFESVVQTLGARKDASFEEQYKVLQKYLERTFNYLEKEQVQMNDIVNDITKLSTKIEEPSQSVALERHINMCSEVLTINKNEAKETMKKFKDFQHRTKHPEKENTPDKINEQIQNKRNKYYTKEYILHSSVLSALNTETQLKFINENLMENASVLTKTNSQNIFIKGESLEQSYADFNKTLNETITNNKIGLQIDTLMPSRDIQLENNNNANNLQGFGGNYLQGFGGNNQQTFVGKLQSLQKNYKTEQELQNQILENLSKNNVKGYNAAKNNLNDLKTKNSHKAMFTAQDVSSLANRSDNSFARSRLYHPSVLVNMALNTQTVDDHKNNRMYMWGITVLDEDGNETNETYTMEEFKDKYLKNPECFRNKRIRTQLIKAIEFDFDFIDPTIHPDRFAEYNIFDRINVFRDPQNFDEILKQILKRTSADADTFLNIVKFKTENSTDEIVDAGDLKECLNDVILNSCNVISALCEADMLNAKAEFFAKNKNATQEEFERDYYGAVPEFLEIDFKHTDPRKKYRKIGYKTAKDIKNNLSDDNGTFKIKISKKIKAHYKKAIESLKKQTELFIDKNTTQKLKKFIEEYNDKKQQAVSKFAEDNKNQIIKQLKAKQDVYYLINEEGKNVPYVIYEKRVFKIMTSSENEYQVKPIIKQDEKTQEEYNLITSLQTSKQEWSNIKPEHIIKMKINNKKYQVVRKVLNDGKVYFLQKNETDCYIFNSAMQQKCQEELNRQLSKQHPLTIKDEDTNEELKVVLFFHGNNFESKPNKGFIDLEEKHLAATSAQLAKALKPDSKYTIEKNNNEDICGVYAQDNKKNIVCCKGKRGIERLSAEQYQELKNLYQKDNAKKLTLNGLWLPGGRDQELYLVNKTKQNRGQTKDEFYQLNEKKLTHIEDSTIPSYIKISTEAQTIDFEEADSDGNMKHRTLYYCNLTKDEKEYYYCKTTPQLSAYNQHIQWADISIPASYQKLDNKSEQAEQQILSQIIQAKDIHEGANKTTIVIDDENSYTILQIKIGNETRFFAKHNNENKYKELLSPTKIQNLSEKSADHAQYQKNLWYNIFAEANTTIHYTNKNTQNETINNHIFKLFNTTYAINDTTKQLTTDINITWDNMLKKQHQQQNNEANSIKIYKENDNHNQIATNIGSFYFAKDKNKYKQITSENIDKVFDYIDNKMIFEDQNDEEKEKVFQLEKNGKIFVYKPNNNNEKTPINIEEKIKKLEENNKELQEKIKNYQEQNEKLINESDKPQKQKRQRRQPKKQQDDQNQELKEKLQKINQNINNTTKEVEENKKQIQKYKTIQNLFQNFVKASKNPEESFKNIIFKEQEQQQQQVPPQEQQQQQNNNINIINNNSQAQIINNQINSSIVKEQHNDNNDLQQQPESITLWQNDENIYEIKEENKQPEHEDNDDPNKNTKASKTFCLKLCDEKKKIDIIKKNNENIKLKYKEKKWYFGNNYDEITSHICQLISEDKIYAATCKNKDKEETFRPATQQEQDIYNNINNNKAFAIDTLHIDKDTKIDIYKKIDQNEESKQYITYNEKTDTYEIIEKEKFHELLEKHCKMMIEQGDTSVMKFVQQKVGNRDQEIYFLKLFNSEFKLKVTTHDKNKKKIYTSNEKDMVQFKEMFDFYKALNAKPQDNRQKDPKYTKLHHIPKEGQESYLIKNQNQWYIKNDNENNLNIYNEVDKNNFYEKVLQPLQKQPEYINQIKQINKDNDNSDIYANINGYYWKIIKNKDGCKITTITNKQEQKTASNIIKLTGQEKTNLSGETIFFIASINGTLYNIKQETNIAEPITVEQLRQYATSVNESKKEDKSIMVDDNIWLTMTYLDQDNKKQTSTYKITTDKYQSVDGQEFKNNYNRFIKHAKETKIDDITYKQVSDGENNNTLYKEEEDKKLTKCSEADYEKIFDYYSDNYKDNIKEYISKKFIKFLDLYIVYNKKDQKYTIEQQEPQLEKDKIILQLDVSDNDKTYFNKIKLYETNESIVVAIIDKDNQEKILYNNQQELSKSIDILKQKYNHIVINNHIYISLNDSQILEINKQDEKNPKCEKIIDKDDEKKFNTLSKIIKNVKEGKKYIFLTEEEKQILTKIKNKKQNINLLQSNNAINIEESINIIKDSIYNENSDEENEESEIKDNDKENINEANNNKENIYIYQIEKDKSLIQTNIQDFVKNNTNACWQVKDHDHISEYLFIKQNNKDEDQQKYYKINLTNNLQQINKHEEKEKISSYITKQANKIKLFAQKTDNKYHIYQLSNDKEITNIINVNKIVDEKDITQDIKTHYNNNIFVNIEDKNYKLNIDEYNKTIKNITPLISNDNNNVEDKKTNNILTQMQEFYTTKKKSPYQFTKIDDQLFCFTKKQPKTISLLNNELIQHLLQTDDIKTNITIIQLKDQYIIKYNQHFFKFNTENNTIEQVNKRNNTEYTGIIKEVENSANNDDAIFYQRKFYKKSKNGHLQQLAMKEIIDDKISNNNIIKVKVDNQTLFLTADDINNKHLPDDKKLSVMNEELTDDLQDILNIVQCGNKKIITALQNKKEKITFAIETNKNNMVFVQKDKNNINAIYYKQAQEALQQEHKIKNLNDDINHFQVIEEDIEEKAQVKDFVQIGGNQIYQINDEQIKHKTANDKILPILQPKIENQKPDKSKKKLTKLKTINTLTSNFTSNKKNEIFEKSKNKQGIEIYYKLKPYELYQKLEKIHKDKKNNKEIIKIINEKTNTNDFYLQINNKWYQIKQTEDNKKQTEIIQASKQDIDLITKFKNKEQLGAVYNIEKNEQNTIKRFKEIQTKDVIIEIFDNNDVKSCAYIKSLHNTYVKCGKTNADGPSPYKEIQKKDIPTPKLIKGLKVKENNKNIYKIDNKLCFRQYPVNKYQLFKEVNVEDVFESMHEEYKNYKPITIISDDKQYKIAKINNTAYIFDIGNNSIETLESVLKKNSAVYNVAKQILSDTHKIKKIEEKDYIVYNKPKTNQNNKNKQQPTISYETLCFKKEDNNYTLDKNMSSRLDLLSNLQRKIQQSQYQYFVKKYTISLPNEKLSKIGATTAITEAEFNKAVNELDEYKKGYKKIANNISSPITSLQNKKNSQPTFTKYNKIIVVNTPSLPEVKKLSNDNNVKSLTFNILENGKLQQKQANDQEKEEKIIKKIMENKIKYDETQIRNMTEIEKQLYGNNEIFSYPNFSTTQDANGLRFYKLVMVDEEFEEGVYLCDCSAKETELIKQNINENKLLYLPQGKEANKDNFQHFFQIGKEKDQMQEEENKKNSKHYSKKLKIKTYAKKRKKITTKGAVINNTKKDKSSFNKA